jgi:hypothetical protein
VMMTLSMMIWRDAGGNHRMSLQPGLKEGFS